MIPAIIVTISPEIIPRPIIFIARVIDADCCEVHSFLYHRLTNWRTWDDRTKMVGRGGGGVVVVVGGGVLSCI